VAKKIESKFGTGIAPVMKHRSVAFRSSANRYQPFPIFCHKKFGFAM
jgi:hypothetical protein